MNPFLLHVVSGNSLYTGAAVLLLALGLSPWCRRHWLRTADNLLAIVGLLLLRLSAAPFASIVWWTCIVLFLVWLTIENALRLRRPALLRTSRFVTAAVTLALVGAELPHAFMPALVGPTATSLVVLGDSISAGISRDAPWPARFADRYRIPVTNLSRPGATVSDALPLVAKIPDAATLVLIELGGNDMLSQTPSADFERHLGELLTRVSRPGRTLVMLELPLIPFQESYGRTQRILAARYHVTLIPKRRFAGVLASSHATSDGLHLSAEGADTMAEMIHESLGLVQAPLIPAPACPASRPAD